MSLRDPTDTTPIYNDRAGFKIYNKKVRLRFIVVRQCRTGAGLVNRQAHEIYFDAVGSQVVCIDGTFIVGFSQ